MSLEWGDYRAVKLPTFTLISYN